MVRKKNNHGFTLAELLIVVAIIAVLVAVSIPIFNKQLEKAREATDLANFRAAKADVVVAYLSDEFTNGEGTYWYDAATGKFTTEKANVEVYGKGTTITGLSLDTPEEYASFYDVEMSYTDAVVAARYAPSESIIDLQWRNISGEEPVDQNRPGFIINLDSLG